MKKMSYLMLSGLIATSFLTVNCQKSPSKRGIKSKTGIEDIQIDVKAGEKSVSPEAAKNTTRTASETATTAGQDTEKSDEKVIAQVCSDATKELIIDFKTMNDATKELVDSKDAKTQDNLDTILENRKAILEKCNVVLADISKYTGASCMIGTQGIKKDYISVSCLRNGEALKSESKVENKFAVLAEKEVVIQKATDKFMESKFVITDDGKIVLDEDSLNFAKYISKGVINYTSTDLNKVVAAKNIACSFSVADTTDVQLGVETVLELKSIENETTAVPEDFKGKATSFNFISVNDEGTKSPAVFNLVCLNVDSENLNTAKLKSTLGELLKVK